jgi:hypothetical protein
MTELILAMQPAWLAIVSVWRALYTVLRSVRVSVDGVMIMAVIVAGSIGGWYISNHAKTAEHSRILAAEARASRKINDDLHVLIAHERGKIATNDARLASITSDIKELYDGLPTRAIVNVIPPHVVLAAKEPAPVLVTDVACPVPSVVQTTAVVPSRKKLADMDQNRRIREAAARAKLNNINSGGH